MLNMSSSNNPPHAVAPAAALSPSGQMGGGGHNRSRSSGGLNSSSSSSSLSAILTSPFSSSSAGANAAPRRSWLPRLLPVQALEDPSTDLEELQLRQDATPEEAEEVTEKSDLDAAAEDRAMPLAFNSLRHEEDIRGEALQEQSWRMRERMKTVSVALVICLNVGVDPPDVTKTQPCARTECWVDPVTLNPQRAIEQIGNNLQRQYERWQPRARYRLSLDPPLEEVRRLATGLRRNAREERVLFHYNGHGVPKPTANGEIWVFNRNYTQYIPLSLYDLQSWMGSPSIFVYDCSNAGIIVQAFEQFADQHEREYLDRVNMANSGSSSQAGGGGTPSSATSSSSQPAADLPPPPILQRNCIQLAACSATQILPMNPELPADLFTSCLTTPIKMALRWFVMQGHGKLAPEITVDMLDKIPGQFGDRRTMLGELNWIFTAITDTIAWNTLPRDLFQKLFRQDLLVASLFRNFLLAERIMRSYDCTPMSQPSLPHTHQHPMWKAWDLAVDISLSQLPRILAGQGSYVSSTFFEEQLTAFEVWLKHGSNSGAGGDFNRHQQQHRRPPPEQLPIVLQVLLSQAHRLRALDLLGRFLDLGPWAVNLALSVGIFPYVLKLLQSSARELRPLLVSIWSKILAVDPSCQTDLIRDSSHKYFLSVLQDESMAAHHRTLAAFILATVVHNFPQGQQEAEQHNMISICLEQLDSAAGGEALLRQWLTLAVGRVWDKNEKARWRGARDNAHTKLYALLKDPVPEVRASAVFALGTFINSCAERTEHANNLDHSVALNLLNACKDDASPIVRAELAVALSFVVEAFEANFVTVCRIAMQESTPPPQSSQLSPTKMTPSVSSPSLDQMGSGGGAGGGRPGAGSGGNLPGQVTSNNASSSSIFRSPMSIGGGVYTKIWNGLRDLAVDPYPQVSSMSESLLLYLKVKAQEKERYSRAANPWGAHQSKVGRSKTSGNFGDSPTSATGGVISSVPSSPARASFIVGGSSPPAPKTLQSPSGQQGQIGRQQKTVRGSQADEVAGPAAVSPQQGAAAPPAKSSLPSLRGTRSHNPSPTSTQTSRDLRAPELRTEFLPWASKYFSKQLMQHKCVECDCDHESARHWTKEWLYKRNLEVRAESEAQRDWLKTRMCKLDDQVSSFTSFFSPRLVLFHPYNNQLAVGGAKNILVQDLDIGAPICEIQMQEKRQFSSQFTSLSYLNAHDEALLLAGSDDGFLRVYKDLQPKEQQQEEDCGLAALGENYSARGDVKLVTAWNALREMTPAGGGGKPRAPSSRLRGLCVAWEQKNRMIAVGGDDCNVVRLWDASRELKVCDLKLQQAESSSGVVAGGVTCLSFSNVSPHVLTAGFADGRVCAYDVRQGGGMTAGGGRPPAPVWSHREHGASAVLDCQVQDVGGFAGHVVSGAADGSIRVADPRKTSHLAAAAAASGGTIVIKAMSLGQSVNTISIHKRAFAVAAWTSSHVAVVHSLLGNGAQLNSVRSHGESGLGLLGGHRGSRHHGLAGPSAHLVGCLAFHPQLIQLATAPADGHIGVYSLRRTM